MDQVLPLGGDEGTVVWRQTHGLGLFVTHPVGRVEPHHAARVGLVQGHQVELERRCYVEERRKITQIHLPMTTFSYSNQKISKIHVSSMPVCFFVSMHQNSGLFLFYFIHPDFYISTVLELKYQKQFCENQLKHN